MAAPERRNHAGRRTERGKGHLQSFVAEIAALLRNEEAGVAHYVDDADADVRLCECLVAEAAGEENSRVEHGAVKITAPHNRVPYPAKPSHQASPIAATALSSHLSGVFLLWHSDAR